MKERIKRYGARRPDDAFRANFVFLPKVAIDVALTIAYFNEKLLSTAFRCQATVRLLQNSILLLLLHQLHIVPIVVALRISLGTGNTAIRRTIWLCAV